MSVQFGRWNFDGKPVDRDYLEKAKASVAPYGPDDAGSYSKDNISILYHAFYTTKESRRETQPQVTASGAILTWDGRLDNRADLIEQLRDVVTAASTDVEIVASAYEYWGSDCLAMLIGDWALSLWDPHAHSLVLAKDPIGTRHLYYSLDKDRVTWSTILDPLVLSAGRTFSLNEEYIAGWFSFFPAAHLTPYVGISSVPPSSSVLIRVGKQTVRKYWDFDPSKRIGYSSDAEYEEHFRYVFAEAVRRRLRSDSPILAELSGGMDSSSIVCVADTLIASGIAEAPRLDTLSYYDDSEPNWNEKPYFTKVEEKRGRSGCHIHLGSREGFWSQIDTAHFAATPSSIRRLSDTAEQFAACISSQENRVVLSGIGGDEVMGGVPTAVPELRDLLVRALLEDLAHQLKVWALNKRKPWFNLLFEATRGFFPPALFCEPVWTQPAPWLRRDFVERNRAALRGYENRLKLFGALPSFQESVATLELLRRQLGCFALASDPVHEKRFSYLDRDLLGFMYAIPRQQLVRPGQRRSLMRRALAGIVPDEILNRKRKAYAARAAMVSVSRDWTALSEMSPHLLSSSMGFVDSGIFLKSLEDARRGMEVPLVVLTRTLDIELWLTAATNQRVFGGHSLISTPVPLRSNPQREPSALLAQKVQPGRAK